MTISPVWLVRGAFTLGAAASLAANVLAATDDVISRCIAAWPPLALLLAVELISRIPVTGRMLGAVRIIAAATIAGIAAWVSYWHMVEVIQHYGETGSAPYLIPLSVDGLMVVASVCLVEVGKPSPAPSPAPAPEPEDIPAPEPEPEAIRKTPLPRGYVKATAQEVIRANPAATVDELAAVLVDKTGTHTKHARKTITNVLQEV